MKILVSGIVLSVGIQIILCTDIYHHCYQEGAYCGKKNITCYNNTVIYIVWSRVGYSKYWELDATRTNCSVTDDKYEKEIDEPSKNCSGLPVCQLYTCSNSLYQLVKCDSNKATNYMRINYMCIKANTSDTTDTNRQSTSDYESQSNVAVTTSKFQNTLDPNDTSRQSRSDTRKTTIIVISVMTVIIIIVVVVSIIIIRRRRKKKEQSQPGDDPKEANNSPVLNKQESGVNVIDSANYVTSGKVTEDTFDLETRCVGDPSLETSVVDNLNYASFGQREDIDQIDLPTSKADLNTDTELVDNDDYVGFGEK